MKNFFLEKKSTVTLLIIALLLSIILLGDNIYPTNTLWLHNNNNEFPAFQSGWFFFRNDIWRFPLGINPNYGDGIGSSIVYSDSIPLLAIIFKSVKWIIPQNFQYFSLWYFVCFFFQLFFSYQILLKFTKNNYFSFVGSLFFALSPIFIYRMGWHPSLAGQWILLLTLYLSFTKKFDESLFFWILILILSCLIHFYFTITILIIFILLSFLNYLGEKKSFFNLIKNIVVVFVPLLLVMYLVGYFEIRTADTMGLGFGSHRLNILSIFDPAVSAKNELWSSLLPDIKLSTQEELEGFNYLGLGQMLMILLGIILFLKNKNKEMLQFLKNNKNFKNFFWISLILTLIALSNKISIGSYTLIEIPLNKFLYAASSLIRSSGRLFWIVNYFLVFLSLLIIFRSLNIKKSLLAIVVLLAIQIADISTGLKNYIKLESFTNKTFILKDPIWNEMLKKYKIIKTTLPVYYNSQLPLLSNFYEKNSIKKTNLIMLARANRKLVAEARYNLYEKFNNKNLNSNIIYIIDNLGHLMHLKEIFSNKDVGFFFRDNIWIMLKNKKNSMDINDITKFNNIKPEKLEINKKTDLYFRDQKYYHGFGWSHNFSQKGIWSDGKMATLLFRTEQINSDQILEIHCNPYITEKNKNINIKIYLNNEFNQDIKFEYENGISENIIKVLLKNDFIQNNENIKVDFLINNPVSPLENFESPDSRMLGILVKNIQLKEI